jgi:hypothetical protein
MKIAIAAAVILAAWIYAADNLLGGQVRAEGNRIARCVL